MAAASWKQAHLPTPGFSWDQLTEVGCRVHHGAEPPQQQPLQPGEAEDHRTLYCLGPAALGGEDMEADAVDKQTLEMACDYHVLDAHPLEGCLTGTTSADSDRDQMEGHSLRLMAGGRRVQESLSWAAPGHCSWD